jgi:predicted phosphodiesterase
MKLAVISDIHSNLHALNAVLEEIDAREADRIFALGDLVGYNALPREVLKVITTRNILSIMGNHDIVCCGRENPIWFNESAREAALWTRDKLSEEEKQYLSTLPNEERIEQKIYAVHGSPMSRDDYLMDLMDALNCLQYLPDEKIQVCFFGHTHIPSIFSSHGPSYDAASTGKHTLASGNRYFINPGAVGQPRDGDPRASFALFDTEEQSIEIIRIEYDVESARQAILDAGLPKFFSDRLLVGA